MTKAKYIPPRIESITFKPEQPLLESSSYIKIDEKENVDESDKSSRLNWYEQYEEYWAE